MRYFYPIDVYNLSKHFNLKLQKIETIFDIIEFCTFVLLQMELYRIAKRGLFLSLWSLFLILCLPHGVFWLKCPFNSFSLNDPIVKKNQLNFNTTAREWVHKKSHQAPRWRWMFSSIQFIVFTFYFVPLNKQLLNHHRDMHFVYYMKKMNHVRSEDDWIHAQHKA